MKKYRLPANSPLFLELTLEDLWIEFFEDLYEKQPNLDLEEAAASGQKVQMVNTGDPSVDKVEQLLAADEVDEDALLRELESWGTGKTPSIDDTKAAEIIGDGFALGSEPLQSDAVEALQAEE